MDLQNQFSLCELIGGMTLEEMRSRMSVNEFHGWIAHKKIEEKRIAESHKKANRQEEEWD